MAVNEKTSVDVQTLRPFKRFIMTLGLLPTSYLESMTYAELIMWFCNFLQEQVIPTVNNNAEAVIELQNWFNNLDLQEEVDHKLDEMAESGELTDIIAQYLGLAGLLTFNTVSDMKNATNLVNGSTCQTLGYHDINDGGSAIYKVRNITNSDTVNEMDKIALNNENLIAEIVLTDKLNINQFGAIGDNSSDNTDILKYCVTYCLTKHLIMYIPNGRYILNDTLTSQSYGILIEGEGQSLSRLIMNADKDLFNVKYGNFVVRDVGFIAPASYTKALINFNNSVNMFTCIVENCGFSGVQSGKGINIAPTGNVNIQNCTIKNCLFYKLDYGIYIDTSNGYFNGNSIKDSWVSSCAYGLYYDENSTYGTSNLVIDNFKGQYSSGISTALIYNLTGSNNSVNDCLLWDGGKTLNISPNGKYTYVRNIGDLSLTKFENYGYRTFIEASDYRVPGGKYYEFTDNFNGQELSNIWTIDKSEGASVTLDNTTPGGSGLQRPSVKLSTGTTANNYVKLTLDNTLMLETGRWSMMFDLNISSASNILVNVGGYTPTASLYGNLISFDSRVNSKLRGISTHGGTIDYTLDLLDTLTTNNYLHCQITKDKNDYVYFWINNNYIGKITPRGYSELPYFYVQTLDGTDKSIRIVNLKIQHYIFE